MSKVQKVRDYLKQHPECKALGAVELGVKVGVSAGDVHNALRPKAKAKHKAKAKSHEPKAKSFALTVSIPHGQTVAIKLANGKLIGTLEVSDRGFVYSRPNAKLKNKEIPWASLHKLSCLF